MLTITNFEHRVNVIQWLKTEGLAHYEREDHIDWDIVSEEDIQGMLVDMFCFADCGEHLDSAIFNEICTATLSETLLKLAFRGTLQDSTEAQAMLHDAMFDTLKAYAQSCIDLHYNGKLPL